MKILSTVYYNMFFISLFLLGVSNSQPQPQLLFSLGLPINDSYGSPLLTGSVVSDINNDGILEIIQNAGNKLFVLDHNGQNVNGWPQSTIYTLQQNAAVGDITGDGYKELVAIDRNYDGNSYLYAWNYQGNSLPGFPLSVDFNSGSMPKTPILIDLNHDNTSEIIFNTDSTVIILNGFVNNINGWPKIFEERVYDVGIGDFNGDNNIDIICRTLNSFQFFNADGSQLFDPFIMNDGGIGFMTHSFADIDFDGDTEIFSGIFELGDTSPWPAGVVLIDPEIGIVNGWPQWLADNQFVFDPCSWADLDGDDTLEIVFGDNDGLLHVMDIHGSYLDGFPAHPGNSITAGINPPIGDVDGDGDMEIFIDNNIVYGGGSSRYHVFHHNGEEVSWSPQYLNGIAAFIAPALGDLDNDGSVEIIYVVTDYLSSNQAGLHVYTLPGVPFETATFPWPMKGHDPQNTMWYDYPYYLKIDDDQNELLPHSIVLNQNYPNPFNNSTIIPYEVDVNSHVRISVYNILGEEKSVLVNDNQSPGKHQILWKANDSASGVYFIKLETGFKSIIRKTILLK